MKARLIAAAIVVIPSFRLFAQPDPAPPAFEVASIRPHEGPGWRTGPLTVSGTLVRLEGYTVFGLVMDAWNVRDFQLAAGAGASFSREEISGTQYDIVARAPGEAVPKTDEVRAMLRTLLTDRFKLQVHRETREMPVYALVSEKKRPAGLKPSTAAGPCVHVKRASYGRNTEETFSNCDSERLADAVGHLIRDRPVVDKTGLTGNYDFRLVALGDQVGSARTESVDDISPFIAVGKLGLKLVKQKAPIDFVVVDHLEKPTGN